MKGQRPGARRLGLKLHFLSGDQFVEPDIPETLIIEANVLSAFGADRTVFFFGEQLRDIASVHPATPSVMMRAVDT